MQLIFLTTFDSLNHIYGYFNFLKNTFNSNTGYMTS